LAVSFRVNVSWEGEENFVLFSQGGRNDLFLGLSQNACRSLAYLQTVHTVSSEAETVVRRANEKELVHSHLSV
jgi:hypothetical protein